MSISSQIDIKKLQDRLMEAEEKLEHLSLLGRTRNNQFYKNKFTINDNMTEKDKEKISKNRKIRNTNAKNVYDNNIEQRAKQIARATARNKRLFTITDDMTVEEKEKVEENVARRKENAKRKYLEKKAELVRLKQLVSTISESKEEKWV